MGADIFLYVERLEGNVWKHVDVPKTLLPDDRCYSLFEWIQQDSFFIGRGKPAEVTEYIGDFGFTFVYLDEMQHVDWDEVRDIEDHSMKGCYFHVFFQYVLPRFTDCLTVLKQRDVRISMGFNH